jgi:hypothetical protein
VYVGTDLGVWLSRNGGDSWELFSAGAPNALLAMHLSISADRKLRVATHGLGVWQAPLAELVGTKTPLAALALSLQPNPVVSTATLAFDLPKAASLEVRVVDVSGRELYRAGKRTYPVGKHSIRIDCASWPAGLYGLILDDGAGRVSRILVKQ